MGLDVEGGYSANVRGWEGEEGCRRGGKSLAYLCDGDLEGIFGDQRRRVVRIRRGYGYWRIRLV